MKITKREFIETMTGSKSYFAGVTMELFSKDEVACLLADCFSPPEPYLELRTCKAGTEYLEFCNHSYLSLYPKTQYFKYEYPGAIVLMATYDTEKTMYYLIREYDQRN